ncbi:MogA/MoaB family molybdenum cofactor biosynthesis protein [Pseudodesulfovibrio sediminis]|uniref:Molybdopterin adenylyltransferase n=1 Tax=Pseudodesulfovibrio sediminis TaxID=2810563 RepID=A0ABN6ERI5_9BACT|nr:MogA/MoaB family molybdenum cofactor biosynthesis protein [Pseudodesulfovibrio sediminis]BCS87478.1 molybdenum cofactor biosynthesis protein [Pseudodesulfovibrio sediminis]
MTTDTLTLTLTSPVVAGERLYLYQDGPDLPCKGATTSSLLPSLRAGTTLKGEGCEFAVRSIGWLPGGGEARSTRSVLLEAKQDAEAGEFVCAMLREGWAVAWITLSDKGAAGKRQDESGPLVGKLVGEKLPLNHVQGFVIPDEVSQLKGLMVDLALNQGFDLILTTGGTGVAPRDITPEATLAVIEKRLPGYERAMTAASLEKTPHGAISRAVAGTLGQAVIVNMPGSPKAVAECLAPLLPTLRHTMEKLQGDPSDCASLHK